MPTCAEGFVDNRYIPGMPEYQKPYCNIPSSSCSGCAGSWLMYYIPLPDNTVKDKPVVIVSRLTRN